VHRRGAGDRDAKELVRETAATAHEIISELAIIVRFTKVGTDLVVWIAEHLICVSITVAVPVSVTVTIAVSVAVAVSVAISISIAV
jgi:hypothetical protein